MKIILWKDCKKIDQNLILCRDTIKAQNHIKTAVSDIVKKVQQSGDLALKNYTREFDGVSLKSLALTKKEWQKANQIDQNAKQAINFAYKNIKRFHQLQLPKDISSDVGGVNLIRQYKAIESVGLYIPGGSAPLISTLLMLAIPAMIAKCREVIVVTPPRQDGSINPAILYAAKICGISRLYKIGGAQAIAALGYGTKTIPKVMKIFGPGNKYVTEAKLQLSQDPFGAAIDMPAGPSELLIIADNKANPSFVASDLLAQAEHDPEAKVILVTNDQKFARRVLSEVKKQASILSRRAIIAKSLNLGLIIIVNDITEALNLSNKYAPEHLILQIQNPKKYLAQIQNAGSVFIGPWSAEALGDYASGPNHVLPTYGYAKNYSGLAVESFMKSITFQEVSEEGFINLAPIVEKLADLEGLDGHKNSVIIRGKKISKE
jgi:histidinol dehydrogenase